MSGIEKNAYVRHRRRLAADTRELAASAMAPYKVCCKTNIDRLTKYKKKTPLGPFVWQGDVSIFLAMIKVVLTITLLID